MKKEKEEKRKKKVNKIDIAVVAFLAIFSSAFFLYFYKGPSAFGDDVVYAETAYQIYAGMFKEDNFIFSHRFLVNFPIALFYYLFGPSDFSASLWSFTCAVLTVVLTYFIGTILFNRRVGFLGALLFVFFPLVGLLATASGDNIPMEFFATLSVFFFLWGRSEKDKTKKHLKYFASGAFLFSGLLTTPEAFVMFFFFGVYTILSYALNKEEKISLSTFYFVFGIIFAWLLIAGYEFITINDPLFFFKSQIDFYSNVGKKVGEDLYAGIPGATQDPNFYIGVMFPYQFNLNSAQDFLISFWNNLDNAENKYTGFYFYLFLIAAMLLILLKERKSYLMILWAVSTIGYLEFGTMSFPKYIFMHRLERFLLIGAVPVCVTIAIFIERLIEINNPIKYFFVAFCLIVLLYPSILINVFWYKTNYYVKLDVANIAKFLKNQTNPVTVYAPVQETAFLKIFTNFKKDINFIPLDYMKNCGEIKDGYVVAPLSFFGLAENTPGRSWAYGDLQQKCGFELIQTSKAYEETISNNTPILLNPAYAVFFYKVT